MALAALLLAEGMAAQTQPGNAPYRIGPRDLLSLSVLEDSSLDDDDIRVSDRGSIDIAHVGEVAVQGLTVDEAEERIRQALERYLRRASVVLRVVEFRSRPISVVGAVANPGHLPFSGRWTLLEAITERGGLEAENGGRITVVRRASNGLSDRLEIDVEELLHRGNPNVNIPVFAGDLISVPALRTVTVYAIGEVERTGALEFDRTARVTLLVAIARAGGLTQRASSRIRVIRKTSAGEQIELVANYKRILDGREPDLELHDGDVISVKESFF